METIKSVTNSRMISLIYLYDLHTTYFTNVIAGISDADAHNRLNTKANHIAWIAGSLVHQRYDQANSMGIDLKHSAQQLYKDHFGLQENVKYPSLSQYKKDWDAISPLLKNALLEISDEKLDSSFEMEGETMSHYDLIAYNTHREAYCIGQIGLWRRLLGYEAMKLS